MLKSEMQHQFWVTKKAVQRKLGSKEDECIISSDAELDAKIELFKSISESCTALHRLVDQYQERLCILAKEEKSLGKHLKETGKNSKTTEKIMINTGKAFAYCGQTRLTIRPPLLRLFNELEVFRRRAIVDTQDTITIMEKERTEYRAALSWMKSVSCQLDPDSDRALDKFRKAQTHVRHAKAKFDQLSLDCLQKIDLLAAARCNMFSHALVAYMTSVGQFMKKSSDTFAAAANSLTNSPQYSFNILKELSHESQNISGTELPTDVKPIDTDQMLFFLEDYHDNQKAANVGQNENNVPLNSVEEKKLVQLNESLLDISTNSFSTNSATGLLTNVIEINSGEDSFNSDALLPSKLLADEFKTHKLCTDSLNYIMSNEDNSFKHMPSNVLNPAQSSVPQSTKMHSKYNINNVDKNARSDWIKLFAELDPLSNPDDIVSKIGDDKKHNQTA